MVFGAGIVARYRTIGYKMLVQLWRNLKYFMINFRPIPFPSLFFPQFVASSPLKIYSKLTTGRLQNLLIRKMRAWEATV